ncbi:asparagine synthase-related protein [Paenibacillus sacheonensis]|uniref:asparagine synthase (glutamine-hydrolyzing) n=1 Tax=Paenibacillus sacheonensis TaxID=742054 RepID=A0A7X5BWX8_9BACL|nr:asparagine synthase-related protein [Paenibacillus sacheonensis]MBM7567328.1 asparagine synthase (glutamine-hydrolyzing) [Paenibacillus sacheonensis]NBC69888.1 asparagine synthetase B [Paenibacillus sacheonensis]
MSAICGMLYAGNQEADDSAGAGMMDALHIYPSDRADSLIEGPLYLGCHHQWVTSESIQDRLPRYDRLHRLAITADAIIDNREELFSRLAVEPSVRREMPDSELILLAYRKWGREAPRYLLGDYTFVIWDESRQELFGARDLFGNRTLYYHVNQDRLAFCTAINPLFSLGDVKKELNEKWLSEFLAIPLMVESPELAATVYANIEQLPPAHCFTFHGGQLKMWQFDSVGKGAALNLKSDEEYEEALRDVFNQAIRSSLRTFKKTGATLSGGLDSGSIASFASAQLRNENKVLHTYSYVPAKDFVDWTDRTRIANESPFIEATVQHAGNIHSQYLDFTGQSSFTDVDEWLGLLEMPYKYFENSFWLRGIYEQASKDGVGVLLSGSRGNQTISWGPALQYFSKLIHNFRFIRFYRELQVFSRQRGIRRKHLLPQIGRQALPYVNEVSIVNDDMTLPRLISPDFARKTKVFDRLQEHDFALSGSLRHDAMEARSNQLHSLIIANLRGTKGTKLSLKYGIWDRDPTCDPRVVRFCLSVPLEQSVRDGYDRALIRRATKGYLPDKVRLNQQIRGVQAADWIHRMKPHWHAFTEEVEQLCSDGIVHSYMDVAKIKAALTKVGSTPKDEQAFNLDTRILMRSVIVYRFLKQVMNECKG